MIIKFVIIGELFHGWVRYKMVNTAIKLAMLV